MKKKVKQILDLGCGLGAKITELEKHGQVTGIDISPEFIEKCKSFFPKSTFIVMNGENIQLLSNFFDEVHCNDVIEHVNHPDLLLKNIQRVLKTNGTLYLDIPYYQSEKLLETFNQNYSKQVHHQTIFSFEKIVSILNRNHFKINKCKYIKFFDNIYLMYFFLKNKPIKNQQGGFIIKNDTEKLMSYLAQYIYLPDLLFTITNSSNYPHFNQISKEKYNLPLDELARLLKIIDELVSPIFPKTINLECHFSKKPNNNISDLNFIPNYKNLSKYSFDETISKLRDKNNKLSTELNIIKSSKFYKLWPIYEKIKKLKSVKINLLVKKTTNKILKR